MAEWQYVPDISPLLAPIKDPLQTKFLPAILGPDVPIDNKFWTLLALGIQSSGIAILNLTLIVESLLCTSQDVTLYLSGLLLLNKPISTHNDYSSTCAAGASNSKEQCICKVAFLQALLALLPLKVKKHLECTDATGAWLTTILDSFSGTT